MVENITDEITEEIPGSVENGDSIEDEGGAQQRKRGRPKGVVPKAGEDDDIPMKRKRGRLEEGRSDKKLGTLQRPLIIEGKRERKSVDVYITKEMVKKREKKFTYIGGKGVKLGDIPSVKQNISDADLDDLHIVHQIMYGRKGKPHNVKKNLRDFCGWPFLKNSKEYHLVKLGFIRHLGAKVLKRTLDLLGLEKSLDKEEMRYVLCEFLLEPGRKGGRKSSTLKKAQNGKVGAEKSKATKGTQKRRGKPKRSQTEEDEDGSLKRKRGRPKKSQNEKAESQIEEDEDAESQTEEDEDASPIRKRGRPKKSQNE